MNKLLAAVLLAALLFPLSGCLIRFEHAANDHHRRPEEIRTAMAEAECLGEIAYDAAPDNVFRVYIREGGIYTPYLVLTNDYGGGGAALLLREEVMDEARRHNDYSSYYENSYIDRYLNTEFPALLTPAVRDAIVTSAIVITAEHTTKVGTGWFEKLPMEIERKVFLLSSTELGYTYETWVYAIEGEKLDYFDDWRDRIAYKHGQATPWMLRTAQNADGGGSAACGIGPDGTFGAGNAYEPSGVRPAFCLPGATPIVMSDEIVPGETVYALRAEAEAPPQDARYIADIAYDIAPYLGHTVYIPENGVYAPYLVLTSNYGGATLLLRRDVRESLRRGDYAAYYEDGAADAHLSGAFYRRLPPEVQKHVLSSVITIAGREYAENQSGEAQTQIIVRKAFLLSAAELAFRNTAQRPLPEEGKALSYFENWDNRAARDIEGQPVTWLLRTPGAVFESAAAPMAPDSLGSAAQALILGVRPAFCLENMTPIALSDEIVPGESVYVVAEEEE